MEPFAERPANETRCGSKTFESFLSLRVIAENGDEYAAVAEIGRNLDVRHGHETDPRILNLTLDDFTDLDSNLFFDSILSSSLHLYNLDIGLDHALRRDPFRFHRCI